MSESKIGTTIPTWSVADRMRKSLDHAGMSVDDMAAELHVSGQSVRDYINGKTKIDYSKKVLWAQVTRVPFDWIWPSENAVSEKVEDGTVSTVDAVNKGRYAGRRTKPEGD